MKENLYAKWNRDITSYVIKYETLHGLHLSTEFFSICLWNSYNAKMFHRKADSCKNVSQKPKDKTVCIQPWVNIWK